MISAICSENEPMSVRMEPFVQVPAAQLSHHSPFHHSFRSAQIQTRPMPKAVAAVAVTRGIACPPVSFSLWSIPPNGGAVHRVDRSDFGRINAEARRAKTNRSLVRVCREQA